VSGAAGSAGSFGALFLGVLAGRLPSSSPYFSSQRFGFFSFLCFLLHFGFVEADSISFRLRIRCSPFRFST